jgi:hypothetical protein
LVPLLLLFARFVRLLGCSFSPCSAPCARFLARHGARLAQQSAASVAPGERSVDACIQTVASKHTGLGGGVVDAERGGALVTVALVVVLAVTVTLHGLVFLHTLIVVVVVGLDDLPRSLGLLVHLALLGAFG